jgi:hypothetical protein
MGLIPWLGGKKKEENALVPVEKNTSLVKTEESNEIVIYQGQGTGLANSRRTSAIQVRAKPIKIAGKVYNIDPHQLIRMIKNVTQSIGEYKSKDNPYADYVVGALRKARSDMVNDLEHHFRIHWEVDESTGRSQFYMQ